MTESSSDGPRARFARAWAEAPQCHACENGLGKVIALLPERRKRQQDRELRLPKVDGRRDE
jgi:hypothetical protein